MARSTAWSLWPISGPSPRTSPARGTDATPATPPTIEFSYPSPVCGGGWSPKATGWGLLSRFRIYTAATPRAPRHGLENHKKRAARVAARHPLRQRNVRLISVRPAQIYQLCGEAPLLLIVEAGIERLGGIGERLAFDRALAHVFGLPAHLLDDIDGTFRLRADGLHCHLAIGAGLGEVVHGALETGPIFRLLRREGQVGFDAGGARGVLIGDLVCAEFRAVHAVARERRTCASAGPATSAAVVKSTRGLSHNVFLSRSGRKFAIENTPRVGCLYQLGIVRL